MPDIVALNAAIDAYAEQAIGSDVLGGELARQRSLALDAFQGKVIDAAPEGRSEVQDWAVFETISWIMPSMTRIFAGGDNVVEFDPTSPDDEESAEQESEVLNHMVMNTDWDNIVRTWCQDALTTKNAYCMAYIEEKITPEIERYEGQSEEQLALLLQDDVEVVGSEMREDEKNPVPVTDEMGQPVVDPFTGQPLTQPRIIYDIEIKRTKAEKKLKFEVLPPERVLVGEDTPDFTLARANYFEYYERVTISDLRKQGFDIDDDIGDDHFADTEEDDARDGVFDHDMNVDSPDPSMRQVKVRTIWIRYDYDDDGIAELQKVIRIGNEIIHMEPASRIPVACIVPYINTHRHLGMSVADLVFDVQRIKTSMLRSGLDSLYLANQPRHAVSDKVNLDDMLNSRPGGIVRLRQGAIPGEGHVMPLQTENTFPFAQQGLEHMDRVVEARVGVNRMFQGIDSSNINDHDRVGQLSTMAAQRIEDIARIFGTGFKELFSIAHELLIKSGHQGQAMKIRGKWVNVDPSQWRTGRDMRVVAPYAAGNKDSLLQRLMIVANIHEKALAAGLPIVDVEDAYNLALEIGKAADLPASKFFTDPATVPPPEPAPDYTMMALEIENKKVEHQAADSQVDAEINKYKTDISAEIDKYRADIQAQTQLALAQIKAGTSVDLEQVKANLRDAPINKANELGAATNDMLSKLEQTVASSVAQINAAIEEMKEVQEAPVKVVRKGGKIVGKEIRGKLIPLEFVE